MKKIIILLCLLCVLGKAGGQEKNIPTEGRYQQLSIGDAVPDVVLPNVMQYKKERLRLSEFSGRLVILDFWSVHCVSCIKSFPEMEALQKQFGEKIQVVLVTMDSRNVVDAFLAKRKGKVVLPNLPCVTGDRTLSQLFYSSTVPYHVWIDGSGKVNQLTDGGHTTAAAVASLLHGVDPKLPVQREIREFVATESNADPQIVIYASSVQKPDPRKKALGTGWELDSLTHQHAGLFASNRTAVFLFKMAFGEHLSGGVFRNDNRVLLEMKDRVDYVEPKEVAERNRWLVEHQYHYRLSMPGASEKELFAAMQADLQRAFRLHAGIEKRKVRCLVLKRMHNDSLFAAKERETYSSRYDETAKLYRCVNAPLSTFILVLSNLNGQLSTPIVDGTGYAGRVDLELHCAIQDLDALRVALKVYGLELVEEEREIEMLVIRC